MIGDIVRTERLDPVSFEVFEQVKQGSLILGGEVLDGGDVENTVCPCCGGRRLITLNIVNPLMRPGDSVDFDMCIQCFRFYPLKTVYESDSADCANGVSEAEIDDLLSDPVEDLEADSSLLKKQKREALQALMVILTSRNREFIRLAALVTRQLVKELVAQED